MRTVAVVLAGGIGQRFGGDRPKQMQILAGRTLIEHSVAAFEQAPGVDAIMIVMPPGLADPARQQFTADGHPKVTTGISGSSRTASARSPRTRRSASPSRHRTRSSRLPTAW